MSKVITYKIQQDIYYELGELQRAMNKLSGTYQDISEAFERYKKLSSAIFQIDNIEGTVDA